MIVGKRYSFGSIAAWPSTSYTTFPKPSYIASAWSAFEGEIERCVITFCLFSARHPFSIPIPSRRCDFRCIQYCQSIVPLHPCLGTCAVPSPWRVPIGREGFISMETHACVAPPHSIGHTLIS